MENVFQLLGMLAKTGAVALLIGAVVCCVKGKFRASTPIFLLFMASYPMIIGLINQYAPVLDTQPGKLSYLIPYLATGSITLLLIISLLFPRKAVQFSGPTEPSYLRWFLLISGYMTCMLGAGTAFLCWYYPQLIGIKQQFAPAVGVAANNLGVICAAVLLFFASRFNSRRRPNLMRKIIALSLFFPLQFFSLIQSLILLYASPLQTSQGSSPFEAGVNMSSSFVWALLLFALHLSVNDESRTNKKVRVKVHADFEPQQRQQFAAE